MQISLTTKEIHDFTGTPENALEGSFAEPLTGIATLDEAQRADIAFLGNRKYQARVPASEAGLILVPSDYEGTPKSGQAFLRVESPTLALARICARLETFLRPLPVAGVHSTAVVHPHAEVNPTAAIGPHCVIEEGASIGPRTVLRARCFIGRETQVGEDGLLHPGVTVYEGCRLGNRVILQSGVVIGGDGFGYEKTPEGITKLPQIGGVILGDDVEAGANTTIDRARFGNTTVGEGTKIDNLVMIAHNCRVGRNCYLVSQSGISGSTVLEDEVVLGGQAGLVGHIRIGKGTMVGAQSGINHSLEPGSYVRGSPGMPVRTAMRVEALSRRLPELFKRVDKLERLHEEAAPESEAQER